jgi:hypothetical protein
LARFVDSLLDVSRFHAGASPAQRVRVGVRELIEGVVEEFRALHPRKCPRLECVVTDEDAHVLVDRDGAEIVLLNLVGNAARFAPDGEAVTVRASRGGIESMEEELRLLPWDVVGKPRVVRIDVEDRGLGMTPDVLANLFERYHARADSETATGFLVPRETSSGTHLGLRIARAIVEAHDGWMCIESNLGEGTVASVIVPEDEATARLLARLRMASESARRWQRAGRELAVVALGKATTESWDDLAMRWPGAPRVDPLASTCASRKTLLWTFDADLAVAIVPLASRDEDPSMVLGEPVIRAEECAWGMRGFVAGWCRVEEATSFAQAFHIAAERMRRACAHIAREAQVAAGTEVADPAAELLAINDDDGLEPIAILPAIQTTLHVDNEE